MKVVSGMIPQKALIAMSGGVDSSVAAHLLKEQGYDCIGAMMKLYADDILSDRNIDSPNNQGWSQKENTFAARPSNQGWSQKESTFAARPSNRGCCSIEDAEDARAVATALGIPFFVFNFSDSFEEQVIERFIAAYRQGRTPNPCIDCNRFMKFEKFLIRATELEAEYIATGHYAKITQEPSGRYLLSRGVDAAKDQTYVLYAMTQPQLARTLFPLGGFTKETVREIAANLGLATATKRDSQDICFAPDGDYAGFIEGYTHQPCLVGDFISPAGKVIGQHKGIIHYTIGQRKGLGLYGSKPQYVSALDPEANTVTVGGAEDLFSKSLVAGDINLIPIEKLDGPINVQAKVRYSQQAQPAKVWQTDKDELYIEFEKPQRAITPGQAVVFYDGDVVIGGGTIVNSRERHQN